MRKCWAFKSDGVDVSPLDQTHAILPSRYALIAPSCACQLYSSNRFTLLLHPLHSWLTSLSFFVDLIIWPRQIKPETRFNRKHTWQRGRAKKKAKKKKRSCGTTWPRHSTTVMQQGFTRRVDSHCPRAMVSLSLSRSLVACHETEVEEYAELQMAHPNPCSLPIGTATCMFPLFVMKKKRKKKKKRTLESPADFV
jgi:hypothetical protein